MEKRADEKPILIAGATKVVPARKTASSLWRRLLWMVMLWGASVLALGVVATVFRLLMTAAGLKTH
ncbi:DUF2474 domain-containing protein [Dickeya ananatis]|uniref:DUF2474 domain-containing protein n=1 Tax=Dickeya ananatis TaxID=3061286 RepID=UPI00388E9CF8